MRHKKSKGRKADVSGEDDAMSQEEVLQVRAFLEEELFHKRDALKDIYQRLKEEHDPKERAWLKEQKRKVSDEITQLCLKLIHLSDKLIK